MKFLNKLWKLWMSFAMPFGHFMSGVILSILYLTVFLPYGIILRLFSDPLGIKSKPGATNWKALPLKEPKIDVYRKQF